MSPSRGLAEQRLVLQLADDALQSFVAVEGNVLGVIVANAAEATASLACVNGSAAEAAGFVRGGGHDARSL